MRTDNTAPASGAAGGSAGPAGGPSSAYHASTGGAAGGGSVSGKMVKEGPGSLPFANSRTVSVNASVSVGVKFRCPSY